jgi:predicted N-acetyltransferase YhbS
MQDVLVREVFTSEEKYDQVLLLRDKILRKPLGLNLFHEDLSDDEDDIILAAFDKDGTVIGCVMLHPIDGKVVKLRQMAVENEHQRKGIGNLLVKKAEETAKSKGYMQILLHARTTAQEFYRNLGYEPFGDLFTEVTIPHIAMKKTI